MFESRVEGVSSHTSIYCHIVVDVECCCDIDKDGGVVEGLSPKNDAREFGDRFASKQFHFWHIILHISLPLSCLLYATSCTFIY